MNPSNSNHFSAPARTTVFAAATLCLCAIPAFAEPLGLRPSQAEDVPVAGNILETESIDWSALNWDPSKLSVPSANSNGSSWQSPASSKPDISWDRTNKRDGSSAVTTKKTLPTAWDSKVGVDVNVSGQPSAAGAPVDAEKFLPGATTNSSTGAAWASVTAPALNLPAGWDKATIDARFDPALEERKIGTSVSKSVPLNERFSVTLQNGYSMTHAPVAAPQGTTSAVPNTPASTQPPAPYGMSNHFSSDTTAKLNVLPTGTSLSVGTAMSTNDEKWRRSIGAEQKLFDGISVKGSVSETATGIPEKSISAGFTRNW